MFSWKEDLSAIAVIFNHGIEIKNISNNEFYTLLNISDSHPLGFLDSSNSIVVYSDKPSISHTVNGINYNFYIFFIYQYNFINLNIFITIIRFRKHFSLFEIF